MKNKIMRIFFAFFITTLTSATLPTMSQRVQNSCQEGFVLIVNPDDPATTSCVTAGIAQRFIERGWIIVTPNANGKVILEVPANINQVGKEPNKTGQSTIGVGSQGSRQSIKSREELISDFTKGYVGGTIPLENATGDVKEFVLEVHDIETEIAPGVIVPQWAFGFPGEEASVPGPQIRVTEGDIVRITLRNTHTQPHTIHSHGIVSLAQQMDGVKATSHQLLPGEEYTYEFVASAAGTHAYHCHVQTYKHLDMGMYGSFVIEPKDKSKIIWDREYSLTLDEWDANQDPLAAKHEPNATYFLINGKAAPLTSTYEILEDELGLLRITNVGYAPHSLHIHGTSFLVIAKDGADLPQPYRGDTLPIMPGERFDILVKGRDGDFPFHDHMVSNVTNDGVYPGGMFTIITGSEEIKTSDSSLSTYAGQEAKPSKFDTDEASSEGAASKSTIPTEVLEGEVTMTISDFSFEYPLVNVKVGTTITWINEDAVLHSVTEGLPSGDAAKRVFDSSKEAEGAPILLDSGESFSYTFTETGEFDYYCLPHPFMTAKVVVQ